MSSEQLVLRVEGLGKSYRIGEREPYKALRDVLTDALTCAGAHRAWHQASEACAAADAHLGALGRVVRRRAAARWSGSSARTAPARRTLLKILSRITEPTQGQVTLRGRVGSLLEVGTGFHPELTGRENVYLNGTILGMRRAEIARRFDEIVEFSGVERFLDTPVKRYSSGM